MFIYIVKIKQYCWGIMYKNSFLRYRSNRLNKNGRKNVSSIPSVLNFVKSVKLNKDTNLNQYVCTRKCVTCTRDLVSLPLGVCATDYDMLLTIALVASRTRVRCFVHVP